MTLAAQIENLTDINEHTSATIVAANALGGVLGGAYCVVLEEIADTTELNGFISKNHQIIRDAIQREVFETLRLQGKI